MEDERRGALYCRDCRIELKVKLPGFDRRKGKDMGK
jgi:hypothetical protein